MFMLYNKHTIFTWGKHEGKTVEQVMQDDRSYIGWCIKNLDYVIFDDEVLDELQLSEEYYRINNEKEYYSCYDDSDDDSYEYMRQELIDAGIWDWDD